MANESSATPGVTESFLEDYSALRDGLGVVAVDRDAIRVSGPDALDYLQGQCSQDLNALSIGSSVDALILEPQGRLDALVRVTKAADDQIVVDVTAGFGTLVVDRLKRFKLRVKAEIELLDWHCIQLRGARTRSGRAGDVPESPGAEGTAASTLIIPYSWGSLVGVDIFGPDPVMPRGARECGLAALEALRIESGIPEMGRELDEKTIAAEAGLLDRCVSFTKGCYTGQELIARLDARGNRVSRRLRGIMVRLPGSDSGGSAPARNVDPGGLVGARVLSGEKVVGSVTSAAWSPRLGTVAALGYVHRDVAVPSRLEIRWSAGSGDADSRGPCGESPEPLVVEVVELPLAS